MGVLTAVAYVIYIVAAALMVFAILLQEGRGGGLSALGGTQAESAFGATNPIRRMTVVLAFLFFVLAGFLSYVGSRKRVTFEGGNAPATATPEKGGGKAAAETPPRSGADVEETRAADETAPAVPAEEAKAGESAGAKPENAAENRE